MFTTKTKNSQRRDRDPAVLDLYGVYTLLFGTEENDLSLGLTDELRIKLNKRLDKVTGEYTASEPIDGWASNSTPRRVSS